VIIDTAVSVVSSLMWRRTRPVTMATASPTARPPTAVTTKSTPTWNTETEPARAAIAERSATSAVASFTRLSPCRIVTMRRGIPTLRAMAVAATASGGATTAPNAKAAAGCTGSSHNTTRPTTTVLTMTSPTDSSAIGRALCRNSMREVLSAAAYNRGGRNPTRTTSGLSSTCGTPGTYEAPSPTSVSSSGAGSGSRCDIPLTSVTAATSATIPTAVCTALVFQASQGRHHESRRRRSCDRRPAAAFKARRRLVWSARRARNWSGVILFARSTSATSALSVPDTGG